MSHYVFYRFGFSSLWLTNTIRIATGGQQRFRRLSQLTREGSILALYLQPIFQLCLYWDEPYFFHSCVSYWHRCILMIHGTWFMLLDAQVNAVYRNMDVVRTELPFAASLFYLFFSPVLVYKKVYALLNTILPVLRDNCKGFLPISSSGYRSRALTTTNNHTISCG